MEDPPSLSITRMMLPAYYLAVKLVATITSIVKNVMLSGNLMRMDNVVSD